MSALVLHEYPASGNCYKIRLVAAYLGLPLERRSYDIMRGETRTPAFLRDAGLCPQWANRQRSRPAKPHQLPLALGRAGA